MTSIATLFSGGEGVGVGARAIGLTHLWGIEYDERIAGVARANGFHSICADVTSVDMRTLEVPDILHASPVCKNASVAKAKRGEQNLDMQSGFATAEFIRFMRPKVFTLENVWGYRKFEAFKVICDTLTELGYAWDVTHQNAADFGVPQTRKRLILRATRYGNRVLPPYPVKIAPWNGWYAAIEDLIPTLPESRFAPWQLKRLPEGFGTFLSGGCNTSDPQAAPGVGISTDSEPTRCVNAGNPMSWKAFIASGALNDRSTSLSTRDGEHRMLTVTGSHNNRDIKAFVVNESSTMEVRNANESVAAQVSAIRNVNQRTFIVNTREMHDHREVNPLTLRQGEEPIYTLSATSSAARNKAFLVDPCNADGLTIREGDEPMSVVSAGQNQKPTRAWLECGRVVKMTTRALARFQSIPDSYVLPEHNGLACTVIGNMVPPRMYEAIVQGLAETL